MTWRAHCRDCGTDHEPAAHRSADAMDREANRRTAAGDALGAAIWRARAACTRNERLWLSPHCLGAETEKQIGMVW